MHKGVKSIWIFFEVFLNFCKFTSLIWFLTEKMQLYIADQLKTANLRANLWIHDLKKKTLDNIVKYINVFYIIIIIIKTMNSSCFLWSKKKKRIMNWIRILVVANKKKQIMKNVSNNWVNIYNINLFDAYVNNDDRNKIMLKIKILTMR